MKKTFSEWARYLGDERELTLEEFQARVAAHTCDNLALLNTHITQLLGQTGRLEQYLMVTTGIEYPLPNDQRAEYAIARKLLETLDHDRQEQLQAAALALKG